MKQLKILGLGLLVLGALSAFVPAANAALPEFLGTLPNSFTAGSVEPINFQRLAGSLAVKCKKSKGTGNVATGKTGSFTELFEGCTSLGLACTGLLTGETTGDIKVEGTFVLGYQLGGLIPVTALTLGKEVHFECAGILVSVKGCVAGKTTPLTNGKTGTLTFSQTAKGDQEILDYSTTKEKEAGEKMVECALLSEENGSAFGASSQVQTATLAFTNNIELMD